MISSPVLIVRTFLVNLDPCNPGVKAVRLQKNADIYSSVNCCVHLYNDQKYLNIGLMQFCYEMGFSLL